MPYRCTHVWKTATDWTKDGATGSPRTIISEPCHLVAPTMAELLKTLEAKYTFQPIDDLFIPDEPVESVGHNQFEDVDGGKPRGNARRYLCDYSFHVQYYEARPLTVDDLAGIKTH